MSVRSPRNTLTSQRNALVMTCLEAARGEVMRRLRALKLPTKVPVQRLVMDMTHAARLFGLAAAASGGDVVVVNSDILGTT